MGKYEMFRHQMGNDDFVVAHVDTDGSDNITRITPVGDESTAGDDLAVRWARNEVKTYDDILTKYVGSGLTMGLRER